MEAPRCLQPHEFESLCDLVNQVFRSDGKGRMEEQYPLLFAEENFDNLLVMVENGRVVSHVGTLTRDISILGIRIKTVSVGAVATLSSHRGQGLATRLMEAAFDKARREGVPLMLISGGRGLYRRLGAESAGQYLRVCIEQGELPGSDVDITPAVETDLSTLVNLYNREPSRYVRTVEDFRVDVAAAWICDRAGETLVIRKNGNLLGYLGVQKPRPHRPEEANKIGLVEATGVRSAVVQALPAIMKRYGARQADIIINASDRETLHLLDGYDVVLEPQRFGGTSLALLPDRLLGALPEYIEQMLGPGRLTWKVENQDITFTCQGQTQIFPAHRLTQLCFGVVAPDADPMTPIPEHSPLREALETVFPVQLPHYGYNFV